MPKDPARLELLRVFGSDAREMIEARERAITIHHTDDIDSAGDEVEKAVRRVLQRKLPSSYYTGHGHVIDASLACSPQLDIIIADNATVPILFKAEDGTEYFPYESVYAFGEVKSTYYSSKRYVDAFVETIRFIKAKLQRATTPQTYIGNGVHLGEGFAVNERRPYRNPLFSFMIFVNSGNFDPSHLDALYRDNPVSDLPNVICFLDKGIIINAQTKKDHLGQDTLGPLNPNPDMSVAVGLPGRWMFVPFGDATTSAGSNFAVLWFALITHLQGTTLLRPDVIAYLGRLISFGNGRLIG